jgi:hypothetical protein
MAFGRQRFPFTAWAISGAPEDSGVIALWQGEELIFLGRAAQIRMALWEHYARKAAPFDATHYSWELSRTAAQLEADLLREYELANKQLPLGNRKA